MGTTRSPWTRITPGASFQMKAHLTSVSARLIEPTRLLQRGFEGGEGHDERQWRIQQRDRAIARIPLAARSFLASMMRITPPTSAAARRQRRPAAPMS